MRTVTFKSVMWGIARLAGLSPESSDLSQESADTIVEFINRRVREGWENSWWPELMCLEERYYRTDWEVGTGYVAGDEVWHATTGAYWRCSVAHTGQEPVDGSAYWEEPDDLDRYVPYELGTLTPIGETKGIFKNNPRQNPDTAYELAFEVSENGIQVGTEAGNTVWIHFRRRPASFTGTPYGAGTGYVAGDLVYYGTTGEVYRALNGTTGNLPTDAEHWEKVDFPYVIGEFVKMAGYSDWLRNDGQTEKSVAEEERGWGELERAADVALSAQGSTSRARVRVA